MKIIHISDLHLCSSHNFKNLDRTIALLEKINIEEYDHLVITGDISHTSEEVDFYTFRELLRECNLLEADKTSIVIGNYDIFGGVITAEDVISFSGKCKRIDYQKKVYDFHQYFKELLHGCIFPDNESLYPFIKIIDDVALIGLNSVDKYSFLKNPLATNGKIEKIQLQILKKICTEERFKSNTKIVLVHHHFSKFTKDTTHLNNPVWDRIEKRTMKLRRKKRILQMLNESEVKLVMHGHIHKASIYEISGIKFSNAGDSVDNSLSNTIKYQVIDIDDGAVLKQTEYKVGLEINTDDNLELEERKHPSGIL
jgi:3',5'-cyclic AMP phosphodiesterase CpdA